MNSRAIINHLVLGGSSSIYRSSTPYGCHILMRYNEVYLSYCILRTLYLSSLLLFLISLVFYCINHSIPVLVAG